MIDLLLPSVATLLLFALVYFIRKGKRFNHRNTNIFCGVLLFLWSLYLAQWVLTPIDLTSPRLGGINFSPFKTIGAYIEEIKHGGFFTGANVGVLDFFSKGISTAGKNIGANVLFFVPVGILLVLTFKNSKFRWMLLWSLLIPVFIETWQYFLCASRACDIDDIILNMIGILLGYGIILANRRRHYKRPR